VIPQRATAPGAAGSLLVAPYDGGRDLPPLSLPTPAGGFTQSRVWEASLAYADDVGESLDLSRRRLTLCAERALYRALPASVKKAQAIQRLRGVDRIGDEFRTASRPVAAKIHDALF
jgi:hypothetical protein